MTPIPRSHRIYFFVILLAAGVVALGGLLAPATLAESFRWFQLPPLHARFVGAIYLWGALYMVGALLARTTSEVRWAVPLIAIFTGMLFVVSILNLGAFDLGRLADQIWFASYIAYPIIGVALIARGARESADPGPARTGPLPSWARAFLLLQGIVVTALAGVLLVLPAQAATAWPWPVTTFLAQAYGAPLLAYGIGSLLLSRSWTWREVRAIVPGMLAFAAVTLVASIGHLSVFGVLDLVDLIWFAAFGGATAVLAAMAVLATREAAPTPAPA